MVRWLVLALALSASSSDSTPSNEIEKMLEDQPIDAVHAQIAAPALNMREDVKNEIREALVKSGFVISSHLPEQNSQETKSRFGMVFLKRRDDAEYLRHAAELDTESLDAIERPHKVKIAPFFVKEGMAATIIGSALNPDSARLVFLPPRGQEFRSEDIQDLARVIDLLRESSLVEAVDWVVPPTAKN